MGERYVEIVIKEPYAMDKLIRTKEINRIEVCLDYNECGCSSSDDTHCMYCLSPKSLHDEILKLIEKYNLSD